MQFTQHLDLKGKHAPFGASKFYWTNYSVDQIRGYLVSQYSQQIGTVLHDYAAKHILYKIRLNKTGKNEVLFYLLSNGIPSYAIDVNAFYDNLTNYISDGIGYRMHPEVVLRYSDVCFGTTDAISFDEKNHKLRISDLKNGVTPAHFEQLLIYEALFWLEYKDYLKKYGIKEIGDFDSELRIYQNNEVALKIPEVQEIQYFVDKIVQADLIAQDIRG